MASFKVNGLYELGQLFQQLPNRLQRHGPLRVATNDMATHIQKAISAAAPVDTTLLRRSINRRRARPRKDIEVYNVGILRRAYYWYFQEFGSARNPQNAFIRPTMGTESKAAVDVFKVSFRRGLYAALGLK